MKRIKAQHLGGTSLLGEFAGRGYVVAIGDPVVRARLAERADEAGLSPVTLIHPSATMGADVEIGPGSVVYAGVRLTTDIRLGRHVHLNLNATVGHDTTIEDFVTINPLASISGDVHLVGRV